MLLYEYQAKKLLSRQGIEVPPGALVSAAAGWHGIMHTFRFPVFVKGQVFSGGRGLAGAIRKVSSAADLPAVVHEIAELRITTAQSGGREIPVDSVYVEEGLRLEKELYAAIVLDRSAGCPVLIVAAQGGMEIEHLATEHPEAVLRLPLDPVRGVGDHLCRRVHHFWKSGGLSLQTTSFFLKALFEVFRFNDATLVEVNPIGQLPDARLVALDAKILLDDNAAFRHPEWVAYGEQNVKNLSEREAAASGLNYIKLEDGSVGCMVNGAGLAMATMDALALYGGRAANFLDVGGTATATTTASAFRILSRDPDVKAIFVNIFGGIVRCDLIAQGILDACAIVDVRQPIVVRLEGAKAGEGLKLLEKSGLPLHVATGLDAGIRQAVLIAGRT